jgi:hypothetical protein
MPDLPGGRADDGLAGHPENPLGLSQVGIEREF